MKLEDFQMSPAANTPEGQKAIAAYLVGNAFVKHGLERIFRKLDGDVRRAMSRAEWVAGNPEAHAKEQAALAQIATDTAAARNR